MNIILGAHLNAYSPNKKASFEFNISEPIMLTTLLQRLNIPREEAQMVIINHRLISTHEIELLNEDQVIIYPLIFGG